MSEQAQQAQDSFQEAAPVLGRYRDALMQAGFTRTEAVELCIAAQTAMLFGEGEPDAQAAR